MARKNNITTTREVNVKRRRKDGSEVEYTKPVSKRKLRNCRKKK
jgi:hypothetical protein